jgi:hypothetical protein
VGLLETVTMKRSGTPPLPFNQAKTALAWVTLVTETKRGAPGADGTGEKVCTGLDAEPAEFVARKKRE